MLIHLSGRGKASGLDLGETAANAAHLLPVRDGKVTRLIVYLNRDASGVTPPTDLVSGGFEWS